MLLRRLHAAATTAIEKGIKLEWDAANAETDKLIGSLFGKRVLNDENFRGWLHRNNDARRAFIERTDKGMNLSDRVWKSTRQLRDEMEIAMTIAIGEGDSAASMSRKVRQYLNDPDLMFRRFRYKDEEGNWQRKWKKRITDPDTGKHTWIDYDKDSYRDEWTGPGYYKSSAKNAMRVTRTETNMAYRAADNARWEQLDFILGIHIQPSESHPQPDICDELAGNYPKTFKFTGWHPQCFCVMTPILPKDDELEAMADAKLEGKEYTPETPAITDYPDNFKEFVRDNADNINKARERGTEPYFIRNNAGVIDNILNPDTTPALPQNAYDLIDHLRTQGNLEESYKGGLSDREIYRKWESLSEAERLQVLEQGRYTGMLSTEEDLDFANLYQSTTRESMLGTLQDELENKRRGFDVEDTNHYIIKFKGKDAVVDSFDLEKPLTAAQIKRIEYISANGGLSNYRYWAANDAAKADMMQYMGFIEYKDGKIISSWNDKDFFGNPIAAPSTRQSIAERAAERHAKRTAADVERIQTSWNTRLFNNFVAETDRIGSWRDKDMREWAFILQDEIELKKFHAFKIDYAEAKAALQRRISSETAAASSFMATKENAENMKALAKALGVERGREMTFWEADELRGNPLFATDEIYRINCQTCVVANEMRRRGFSVQALGNFKGSRSETLSAMTEMVWQTADGKTPKKTLIGAEFNMWSFVDPSGKRHKSGWNKLCANRKQLISELESNLTEDGRYHIDWLWQGGGRNRCGHIITVEKIGDTIRYYDPQNGKIVSDFYSYIKSIDLSHGINLLRVDNLRVKTDWAADILTKSGASATTGTAASGGTLGKDFWRIIERRKSMLNSGELPVSMDTSTQSNLASGCIRQSKKSLNRILQHCSTNEELDAANYIWNHPETLKHKRVSPMGEGKDMNDPKKIKNVEQKEKRGVVQYQEYEFEYNGNTWVAKLEETKWGYEQFYHIRKK